MNSHPKCTFYGKYVFIVPKEVYEPAEDTFLLARNLSIKSDETVLDMGTGCGILAVLAAEFASDVVAIDINPHAALSAKKNAELNGVGERIIVATGDLFSPITCDRKFNMIIFNAPYLPVESNEGKSWIEKAWSGGKDGRATIDRFIAQAPQYLEERGRILLVQSTLSNVERTLENFSKEHLVPRIIDGEKSVFEKIVLVEAR